MTDAFRRLGKRTSALSSPAQTSGAALASVLAGTATARPTPAPTPVIARSAQTVGRQTPAWAQEAVAPIVGSFNRLMQEQEDEPWVEVVNSQNEDDFLFMPKSYADNAPPGWEISGEVDRKDMDFVQSDANAYNIFQQPPEVQAAWGVAMPQGTWGTVGGERDMGVIAPPPAPTPTVSPRTPPPPVGPVEQDRMVPVIGQPTFGPNGTMGGSPAQAVPVESPAENSVVRGAATGQTLGGPLYGIATTPPKNDKNWLTALIPDILDAEIPGTDIQVRDLPGEVLDIITGSVPNSESWAAWQQAIKEVGDVFQAPFDPNTSIVGELPGAAQAPFVALAQTFPAVGTFLMTAANAPSEWGKEKRTDIMMKYLNGEDLSENERTYIEAVKWYSLSMETGEQKLPIIGGIVEPIANVLPLDFDRWMLQNPDEARNVYENGYDSNGDGTIDYDGYAAVWEAYQADTGSGWGGMATRFGRDILNDPVSVAPIGGALGRGVRGTGRAIRLAEDASVPQVVTGAAVEGAGIGIEKTARGVEIGADLGIEPILSMAAKGFSIPVNKATESVINARAEGTTAPIAARVGNKLNIFGASDQARREAEAAELERVTAAATQREDPTRGGQIGPDDGGSGPAFDPDAPSAPDGGVPPGLVEDANAAPGRAERARTIPEPGDTEIATGEGIVYSPNVRVVRTEDGWQAETPQGPVAGPGSWADALDDAEIARRQVGDSADDIIMVPPRWIENIEGTSMLDGIARQLSPDQRTALRRAMADEWYASVDTQAALGKGRPSVDHALESSRIALRTAERAQQVNPNVSRPPYRPDYAGERAQPQPYHAMSEALFLPWDETVGSRAYLYGNRNARWSPRNAKKRPARNEKAWIKDRLGPNPSEADIAAARRYIQLVDQHAQWFPNEVGERWAEAQRKADALRNHPALRGREAAPTQERIPESGDLYTDGRYPSEVIQEGDPRTGDGTVTRYTIDEQTHADVTTHAKSKIPKVVQRRHRANPRAGDPAWFSGDIYRDDVHVGHVDTKPDVRAVVDDLVRLANEGDNPFADGTVPPRPEPDTPVAAEPETPTTSEPEPEAPPATEPEPETPEPQAEASPTGGIVEAQRQNVPRARPEPGGFKEPKSIAIRATSGLMRRYWENVDYFSRDGWNQFIEMDDILRGLRDRGASSLQSKTMEFARRHLRFMITSNANLISETPGGLPIAYRVFERTDGVDASMLAIIVDGRYTVTTNLTTPGAKNAQTNWLVLDTPDPTGYAEIARNHTYLDEFPSLPEVVDYIDRREGRQPASAPPTGQGVSRQPVDPDPQQTTTPEAETPSAPTTAPESEQPAPLGRTVRNQTEQPGAQPVEATTEAPKSERIPEEDRPRAGSIDPRALTLDPSLFQFRSTLDNPTGVNEIAVQRMVNEWDPLQQDPVIVWERTPGELVVTSGHHRVTAARRRTEAGTYTPVDYVIKQFDAADISAIRDKARRSNKGTVKESPVDIAHQVKSLTDENPDLTDAQIAKQVDRRVSDIKDFRNIAYLPDALKRTMNAGFDFKAGRFVDGFMFKQKAGAALGEQVRLGRIDGAAAQDFHARYEGAGLSTDEFVEKVQRNIGLMAEKVGGDEATAGTLFNVGDFGSAQYAKIDAIDDQILAEKRKLKAEQTTLKKANRLEDTSPAERKRNEAKIARRQAAIDRLEKRYDRAMNAVAKDIRNAPPNPAPAEVVPASSLDTPSVMDVAEDAPPEPNGTAKPVTMPTRLQNMPEMVSGPDDPAVNQSAFARATDPGTPVTVDAPKKMTLREAARAVRENTANSGHGLDRLIQYLRLEVDEGHPFRIIQRHHVDGDVHKIRSGGLEIRAHVSPGTAPEIGPSLEGPEPLFRPHIARYDLVDTETGRVIDPNARSGDVYRSYEIEIARRFARSGDVPRDTPVTVEVPKAKKRTAKDVERARDAWVESRPVARLSDRPTNTPRTRPEATRPMSEYADRFYHEESYSDATDFLPGAKGNGFGPPFSDNGRFDSSFANEIWFSNDPNLARGQHSRKGVLMEFDPGDMQGRINRQMPGWEFAWDTSRSAEFIVRPTADGQVQSALRSVTVVKPVMGRTVEARDFRRFEKYEGPRLVEQGWVRTETPDSITYTRPDVATTTPAARSTQGPAGQAAYMNVPVDIKKAIVGYRYANDGVRRMIERRRAAEAVRPLPTGFRPTTNTGTLFNRALGWQEEVFLTKNKLADGKTLLEALENYKHQYMTGKSVMWPEQAERAAVAKVRELWDERLEVLYPGGLNTPPFLKKSGEFFDGLTQYFRETVLWNHLRWVSYPMTQWLGNTASLLVGGRPQWVLPYWKNTVGGVRQMRWDERVASISDLTRKIDEYHKTDKPSARARKQQERRLKHRANAITNIVERLKIEHGNVAELTRAIERDPLVLREVWMADPGLSESGKIHAALKTRTGREMTDMYQGFVGELNDPLLVQQKLGAFGERIAGKWGRKIGTTTGGLMGNKRIAKWGAVFDFAHRDTVSAKVMSGQMRDTLPPFRNSVINRHMEWTGVTKGEATAFWNQFWDSRPSAFFSSDEVRAHYGTVLERGQAERLARDWQAEVHRMEDKAASEVRRMTFADGERRADIFLRKALVFHYFFTRQAFFYGHQALRHPVLLTIYDDIQEELAQYAEENEGYMPGWMKGWIAVAGIPEWALNIFLAPWNAFSTYLMFNGMGDFTPDDMTGFGGIFDSLDKLVGLNPFLMAGLDIFGYMGDGYAPDLTFTYAQTEFLTRLYNFGKARGWIGDDARPVGNPSTDFWSWVRSETSGKLPGSEYIPEESSAAGYEREIRMIAADEAAKMGHPVVIEEGMTEEEKAEIEANRRWYFEQMQDPDSELYQRSVKRWSAGELAQTAISFVLQPFRPKYRFGMSSADADGPSVGGLPGTSPDIAGVLSNAEDAPWNLINAGSPESLRLNGQADQYYNIGTERQRMAARSYTLISTGTTHYAITVNGKTYTPLEISNMTDDQRKKLAQAYLQQQGYWDEWQDLQGKQDDFLARKENADFAQMKQWQGKVYDYEGGPMGYWEDYLARNPDNKEAQRYYESVLDANFLNTDRDKALAGMNAYMVTKGIRAGAFDANPDLSWFEANDPVGTLNTPPQPTPKDEYVSEWETKVREGVPQYTEDLMKWDEAVARKQAEFGIDPSIPFNELPGGTRKDIEESLNAEDIYEPSLTSEKYRPVEKYLEWVNQQPAGADISVDAYLTWDEENYEEGATERFEESIAMPKLTDSERIEVLNRLRTEHDRSTYPK